jgi:hypothetical protein
MYCEDSGKQLKDTMMETIIPYLNFNGKAAEALDFYAKTLKRNIESKQAFADAKFGFHWMFNHDLKK